MNYTPEQMQAWKLRQRLQPRKRQSNAQYRCADCTVEVCKRAVRCRACGSRKSPSRRKG